MSGNPQLDPRIIHTWRDDKEWTLCGLSEEEVGNHRLRVEHDTVYQCRYCFRILRDSYTTAVIAQPEPAR